MASNAASHIKDIPHKLVFIAEDDLKSAVPDTFEYADKGDIPSHKSYIMNEVKNNELCAGINKEYLKDALDDALFILYIIKTTRPRTIEGVVIVKDHKDNESIYVDILCGSSNYKGVGSFLLDIVSDIAKKMNKKGVILSSLTQSVGFYIKKGFKFVDTCNMRLNLKGGKRSRRSTRRLRRRKGTRTV